MCSIFNTFKFCELLKNDDKRYSFVNENINKWPRRLENNSGHLWKTNLVYASV